MRTTRQDLQAEVNRLNLITGFDFTLEYANSGYKLEAENQSVVISPRCSASEMAIVLQTLHAALGLKQSK